MDKVTVYILNSGSGYQCFINGNGANVDGVASAFQLATTGDTMTAIYEPTYGWVLIALYKQAPTFSPYCTGCSSYICYGVTVSGITNSDSTICTTFNGTWALSNNGNCTWTFITANWTIQLTYSLGGNTTTLQFLIGSPRGSLNLVATYSATGCPDTVTSLAKGTTNSSCATWPSTITLGLCPGESSSSSSSSSSAPGYLYTFPISGVTNNSCLDCGTANTTWSVNDTNTNATFSMCGHTMQWQVDSAPEIILIDRTSGFIVANYSLADPLGIVTSTTGTLTRSLTQCSNWPTTITLTKV